MDENAIAPLDGGKDLDDRRPILEHLVLGVNQSS